MADWTTDSNEALNLSLGKLGTVGWIYALETYPDAVRAPEDQQSLAEAESYTNFHPSFTYPVSTRMGLLECMLIELSERYMARTRRYTAIKT